MADSALAVLPKRHKIKSNPKLRRSLKHKRNGKYARAFARCVRRTGRWRGRRV